MAKDLIGNLETELLSALPSDEARAALASTPSFAPSEKIQATSSGVLRSLDQALLDGRFTKREYIDNLKSELPHCPN